MLPEAVRRFCEVPTFGTADYNLWLTQNDFLSFLREQAQDEEAILYAGAPHTFIHGVLVPADALEPLDIDDLLNWNDCAPFGSWSVAYTFPHSGLPSKVSITPPLDHTSSKTLDKGEQLVFYRQFDGRNEDQCYFEIETKLAHIHNLHYVPERKAFCRFNEEGDIEDIIRIVCLSNHSRDVGTVVTIRREVLDLHLALTNAALVQVFDSTRCDPYNFGGWNGHSEEVVKATEEQLFYRMGIKPRVGSYVRGFQILTHTQPREESLKRIVGVSEPAKKEYATFITYDWKNKVICEVSCDPKCLSSYFKESDLPFQTTPAFFNPQVLIKYKNDPDKHRLGHRSISCRNAWHLQTYDINKAGQVHTYLIYLSRLPYKEQLYWKSFNEQPKGSPEGPIGPISKRAFTTDFLGKWDESPDPLRDLKRKLNELREGDAKWWMMTSPQLIEQVHYPVTDSAKEWADELLALDQLLVEGLKHNYFKTKLENMGSKPDSEWRSIKLIEECLKASHMDELQADAILEPLRELHRLRTKMRGHAASEQEKGRIRTQLIRKHGSLKQHFRSLTEDCHKAVKLLSGMVEKGTL